MRKFLFINCTIIFFAVVTDLPAQPTADRLVIKLATIDPGAELTSWWGHTGLIVEDTLTGRSLFYNYGLFSFEQDNFVLNFIRGRLILLQG